MGSSFIGSGDGMYVPFFDALGVSYMGKRMSSSSSSSSSWLLVFSDTLLAGVEAYEGRREKLEWVKTGEDGAVEGCEGEYLPPYPPCG